MLWIYLCNISSFTSNPHSEPILSTYPHYQHLDGYLYMSSLQIRENKYNKYYISSIYRYLTWYYKVHTNTIKVPLNYAALYPQYMPIVIENIKMSKYGTYRLFMKYLTCIYWQRINKYHINGFDVHISCPWNYYIHITSPYRHRPICWLHCLKKTERFINYFI